MRCGTSGWLPIVVGNRQSAGKLRIRDGVGSGEIHRAGDRIVLQQKKDGGDQVGDADPAQPLRACAEPSANAPAEDATELGDHAGRVGAQHHAHAQMHDANARVDRRLCCFFPLPAKIGEEP